MCTARVGAANAVAQSLGRGCSGCLHGQNASNIGASPRSLQIAAKIGRFHKFFSFRTAFALAAGWRGDPFRALRVLIPCAQSYSFHDTVPGGYSAFELPAGLRWACALGFYYLLSYSFAVTIVLSTIRSPKPDCRPSLYRHDLIRLLQDSSGTCPV